MGGSGRMGGEGGEGMRGRARVGGGGMVERGRV